MIIYIVLMIAVFCCSLFFRRWDLAVYSIWLALLSYTADCTCWIVIVMNALFWIYFYLTILDVFGEKLKDRNDTPR